MTIRLSSIPIEWAVNNFPLTVNDFINFHRDCLRTRGSPVDKILTNAEQANLCFKNRTDLLICTNLIYGEQVEIGERNFEIIYKFGESFEIHEICSEVKRWIEEELTYDKFWRVYIKLRKLNAKTSFFVNGICRHLSNDNDNFLACTKDLFEEGNVETIAAVADLLLVPEVAHLDAVINARMIPVVSYLVSNMIKRQQCRPYTTAEQKFLEIIIFFIITYIEWHAPITDRDSYLQNLKEFPLPYRCLKTMIRATISIIKVILPNNFDANLPEMDQLINSQDTISTFIRTTNYAIIHPCVVAEIALTWGRLTDLTENATGRAKDIIKDLLENLKEFSVQWYSSVCNDVRYQRFIKYLGLPLLTESSNPHVLDDNGIKTLIKRIIEGKGVESVTGFKYEDGKCPPYGDIPDHWFIKTDSGHVSFIVDSKVDAIVAINASQCISLCCVPEPTIT